MRDSWWLVAGIAIGTAVSNGFARFAYGLVLPAMRSDLGWTYTQAGWMNTANAIGYLVGAVIALAAIKRAGAGRLFLLGMALLGVAIFSTGLTRDFEWLSFWRFAAGVGGAPVFVAAGALAARVFTDDPSRNALSIALGLAGGGGLGMLLSGLSIPVLLTWLSGDSWHWAWLGMGAFALAALWPSWHLVRVMGQGGTAPSAGPAHAASLDIVRVWPALLSYTLFAIGYLAYLTFLIAWMRDAGLGAIMVASTWAVLSLATIASPFLWRGVLSRSGAGGAMASANAITALSVALPLLVPGPVGLMLSALGFGLSFFVVPTAATSFCRKAFAQPQWPAAMAVFTVVFAAGQIIGPITAGLLADRAGDVGRSLWIAALTLALGAVIALLQRRPAV